MGVLQLPVGLFPHFLFYLTFYSQAALFFFYHRAAMGVLQLPLVAGVFIVAAILGDFVNFWIGSKVFFPKVLLRFLVLVSLKVS